MAYEGEAVSPFAAGVQELIRLGYHPIPITSPGEQHDARGKRPGTLQGGSWRGLTDWQRFRDKHPSAFEVQVWGRAPAGNIGIVLGSPVGAHHVIAVDIDTTDADQFDQLIRCLPRTPMRKRGAKGETRFYRAAKTIRTKAYNGADRKRLVDLLTGFDTRQTIVPPSIHPDGMAYTWLEGPVPAADLPLFGEDDLARLEDTLSAMGWEPNVGKRAPQVRDGKSHNALTATTYDADDIWSEVKVAALANLERWVPALELYGCHRARGGYAAVASWRASSTGRPLEQRKANLSIQPIGIKDFGTEETYSAIDLVMAARQVDEGAATAWLRFQLGLDQAEPILLKPREMAPEAGSGNSPPPTGPVEIAPEPIVRLDELPAGLTRVPGLVGELVEWICATARRPQRGLALGAALALVGTAAGRRYAGPTRTGTHLYVLGLARTGAGKDHAGKRIAQVLNGVGMQRHLGPSQFMSLSSVVNRVTREPLTLSAIDEFGAFLARVNSKRGNSHEQAISGMLRQMWSHNFETYMPPEWAQRAAEPIHTPALSIYGVAVPDEFYAALSGADINNGFLNRFLLFATRERPRDREPKVDVAEVPETIKAGMQAIYGAGSYISMATSHNGQADAPLLTAKWESDAAADVYREFGRYIEDREADAAFLARVHEMSIRLATIRAVGCNPKSPIVSVADMEWARDLALWSGERMIAEVSDYMAETETQANSQRIVRLIKAAGQIRHSDLVRKMQQVRARDLKDLLSNLIDGGVIVLDNEPTATKPTKVYRMA